MSDTHIQNFAMISKESSSRHLYYVYVDTSDYAEDIFFRYDIPVHFIREFGFTGTRYRVVFGWFSEEYMDVFTAAMEELRNMMPCDYERYCRWMIGVGIEMLKVILKEN